MLFHNIIIIFLCSGTSRCGFVTCYLSSSCLVAHRTFTSSFHFSLLSALNCTTSQVLHPTPPHLSSFLFHSPSPCCLWSFTFPFPFWYPCQHYITVILPVLSPSYQFSLHVLSGPMALLAQGRPDGFGLCASYNPFHEMQPRSSLYKVDLLCSWFL